jgi:radical SAM-linked protein
MEDLLGIAELAKKVKNEGRRTGQGGEVNVSVGTFVPKPHTPFQWEPQIGIGDIREKQQFLRTVLKKRKLNFKWQDASLSFMEGVFSRGDRRLGKVLLKARELGCRFDGWGELFNFAAWQEAFAVTGVDPLFYHRRRDCGELLPWDHLDCGVTREYLLSERDKALNGAATADCRGGSCTGCGVCDFSEIRMRLNTPDPERPHEPRSEHPLPPHNQPDDAAARVRLRFRKFEKMRFLSHLEMINLFSRAVARARIPIRFSRGFHPHPKFSFATALSVGIASWAEYMDMEIASGYGAEQVMKELNNVLPEGMEILEAREIPLRAESLSVIMEKIRYRVTLAEPVPCDLPAAAARFLALESCPLHREKKGKTQDFDLRRELAELKADAISLEMLVGRGKPLEFTAAVTGLSPTELIRARIEKLAVTFRE